MQWDYRQPVAIFFGEGRIHELSRIFSDMGLDSGVVIASDHFVNDGTVDRIIKESDGAIIGCFSDFSPNPDVTEVDACAALIRHLKGRFIIAIGGGSAMDCAKAASVMARLPGSIRQFHGTGRRVPVEGLPIIAVPTTAGTGSEVTNVAVISDREIHRKAPIVSDSFYPRCAVIDPELTYSVPAHVTACTGMDVLSQAIEGYWSMGHQPICDACAVHATRLVFRYLPQVVKDPRNVLARRMMCEASVTAGLAFSLPKTTAPHACSFPLTEMYGIPHGEACGLTLDYFIRVNGSDERVQEFARLVGFGNVEELASAVGELKRSIGLMTDLGRFHLSETDVDRLVEKSHHPNLGNNPVAVTDEILSSLYESLAVNASVGPHVHMGGES